DQRQRRRPLAQVDTCDLPGLDRVAGAVEDVVRDLEGDPEGEPERAELRIPELARGLEQLPGLQRAALEVGLDRRFGIVRLATLHRLAARERQGSLGEQRDAARVARRR